MAAADRNDNQQQQQPSIENGDAQARRHDHLRSVYEGSAVNGGAESERIDSVVDLHRQTQITSGSNDKESIYSDRVSDTPFGSVKLLSARLSSDLNRLLARFHRPSIATADLRDASMTAQHQQQQVQRPRGPAPPLPIDIPAATPATLLHASPTDNSPLLERSHPAFGADDNDAFRAKDHRHNRPWYRRHAKWLLLLLLFLLGGIALMVTFLCMPVIAQGFMDGAQTNFDSIQIYAARSDAFRANISGRISDAGPFSASTTAMVLSVQTDEGVLGEIEMPPLHLTLGQTSFQVDVPFRIADSKAFAGFSQRLMTKESFSWRVTGQTGLSVMNMDLDQLIFDKTVLLKGMNGFPNVTVKSMNLRGDALESPIQATITTTLTNPSPIGIEVGDLSFEMFYKSTAIGRVSATNVTIASGENELMLVGVLSPAQGDTGDFSELFSHYITGVDTTIQVVSIASNSSSRPEWLDKAMQGLRLNAILPGAENLEMIQEIRLEGVAMGFLSLERPVLEARRIDVDFQMPFDFPIKIRRIRQKFAVVVNGVEVGTTGTEFANASNAINANTIITTLPPSAMDIIPGRELAFSEYLADMFTGDASSFVMKGEAMVEAETPIGIVTLTGVRFNQAVQIKGMQGLNAIFNDGRTSNPVIMNADVVKGLKDQVQLMTDIVLYSPSDVTAHMGDVILEIRAEDVKVGHTLLRNLTVAPGDNRIMCETIFAPPPNASDVTRRFLSNFVNGVPTEVRMIGTFAASTRNPLLATALSRLNLHAPMNGLARRIVESATVKINPFTTVMTREGETSFAMFNSLGETFSFSSMNASISTDGKEIGTMAVQLDEAAEDVAMRPVSVPSRQKLTTAPFTFKMNSVLSADALAAFGRGVAGKLNVNVTAVITAKLGDYPMTLDYIQHNVPSAITLL